MDIGSGWKNPNFDICADIFKLILMILIQEHLTEYDVQKTLKLHKIVTKSSSCTWRHANKIRQRMAIDLRDLANILDKIVLSKH